MYKYIHTYIHTRRYRCRHTEEAVYAARLNFERDAAAGPRRRRVRRPVDLCEVVCADYMATSLQIYTYKQKQEAGGRDLCRLPRA